MGLGNLADVGYTWPVLGTAVLPGFTMSGLGFHPCLAGHTEGGCTQQGWQWAISPPCAGILLAPWEGVHIVRVVVVFLPPHAQLYRCNWDWGWCWPNEDSGGGCLKVRSFDFLVSFAASTLPQKFPNETGAPEKEKRPDQP